jgi:hypothetical protein
VLLEKPIGGSLMSKKAEDFDKFMELIDKAGLLLEEVNLDDLTARQLVEIQCQINWLYELIDEITHKER